MRAIFIDTSGSMPTDEIDAVRDMMRVGDLVICFDTSLHNIKTMQSKADIDSYQLLGFGGTLWEPVRDKIIELATQGITEVLVVTDAYFAGATPTFIHGPRVTFVLPRFVAANAANFLAARGFCVRSLIAA